MSEAEKKYGQLGDYIMRHRRPHWTATEFYEAAARYGHAERRNKAKPGAQLREFNADDARAIARSIIGSEAGRACAWSPTAVETLAALILWEAVNLARVVVR